MKESDKELLELAAKAVGFKWDAYGVSGEGNWWSGIDYLDSWNPLTDDGDALRLAVKLCMQVECSKGWQRVSAYGHSFHIGEAISQNNFNASTAARRAIVRVAAEIGKAMP